jgi:hypothetical protein
LATAFHDQRDALGRETLRLHALKPIQRAEHRPRADACGLEPRLHRTYGAGFLGRAERNAHAQTPALLVGFGFSQRDNQTGLREFEVGHVERNQLRAAEGAGEAEQQQRPVAQADARLGQDASCLMSKV